MNKNIYFPCSNAEACVGCGACEQKCPHNAIKMEYVKGFKYPVVDKSICTECKLCEKCCPANHNIKIEYEQKIYAGYTLNEAVRMNSSSGGVFSVLAACVIQEMGGVVVGCSMSKNCENAEMIMIDSMEELWRIRGSKYVQAETKDIFSTVKNTLDIGRIVLFSGTPCYVAALKTYLGRDYENLIAVDFICHGVPSPKLWQSYLKNMESSLGKVKDVSFRDKKIGWRLYSMKIDFEDNKEYTKPVTEDRYLRSYISNLFFRDSCYKCSFKDKASYSDIKLADFWGVERIYKSENDKEGVSLIITNTKRGEKLVGVISDRLKMWEITFPEGLELNPSYYEGVKKSILRNGAIRDMEKISFDRLYNKHCSSSFFVKLKKKLVRIMEK